MRCNNCKKFIPDDRTICPYCNSTITNEKEIIDFGDLDESHFQDNDKFDLKVFVKDKKNSKLIIGFFVAIFVIILIIIALIMSLFTKNNIPSYLLFTGVVNEASEFLEDNFLLSKTSSAGKYKLLSLP